MKTIYTISVDDDVRQSIDVIEHLKLLCYFIYDGLRVARYESDDTIVCQDGIIPNQLLESTINGKYYYRFKYDDYLSGMYDPFMITDTSFGFTINTGSISYGELMEVINNSKRMINFEYNIKIESYDYMEDDKNINRLNVLKTILSNRENKDINESDDYKKLLKQVKVVV